MKKVIRLTESDLTRIVKRVIVEQNKKSVFEKLIQKFYKPNLNKMTINDDNNMVLNTYKSNREMFWKSFDEYFESTGETPPTMVFIGSTEVKRTDK